MTPEFYFPCRHCGQWRRLHGGKERKCLFQASCFEPKWPLEFNATLERLARLDRQLVERTRERADKLEQVIAKINDAARAGCQHINDQGMGLLERHAPRQGEKYHVICSLCEEDWYEDEEGNKLHPEGTVGPRE